MFWWVAGHQCRRCSTTLLLITFTVSPSLGYGRRLDWEWGPTPPTTTRATTNKNNNQQLTATATAVTTRVTSQNRFVKGCKGFAFFADVSHVEVNMFISFLWQIHNDDMLQTKSMPSYLLDMWSLVSFSRFHRWSCLSTTQGFECLSKVPKWPLWRSLCVAKASICSWFPMQLRQHHQVWCEETKKKPTLEHCKKNSCFTTSYHPSWMFFISTSCFWNYAMKACVFLFTTMCINVTSPNLDRPTPEPGRPYLVKSK